MDPVRWPAPLRMLAILVGLFFAVIAGPFLLGAYAQRFQVLREFRSRGSDGYPFTWDGALLLGGVAAFLAVTVGLALPSRRTQAVYLGVAVGSASLGALTDLVWPTAAFRSAVFYALPLVGVLLVWLPPRLRAAAYGFAALAIGLTVGTIGVTTVREEDPVPLDPRLVAMASATMPSPGYAEFVGELRATGAMVEEEPLDTAQPFFSVRGRMVNVNGERVIIFEYPDTTSVDADTRYIAPDGGGKNGPNEGIQVSWVAPPHFYRRGRLVVQYIGRSPDVTALLSQLMGRQFAGQ